VFSGPLYNVLFLKLWWEFIKNWNSRAMIVIWNLAATWPIAPWKALSPVETIGCYSASGNKFYSSSFCRV
jgi:hypothetical protein